MFARATHDEMAGPTAVEVIQHPSLFLRWMQSASGKLLIKFKYTALRGFILLLLLLLVFWISVFLYGSFYYAYMPTVSHVRPVYLQFSTDCDSVNSQQARLCAFPSANVSFTRDPRRDPREKLLAMGQVYEISLDLEMPESPVNQNQGMFLIELTFYTVNGEISYKTARPTMLRYKSPLLQVLHTLVYSPLLVFGAAEQKQVLSVVLAEEFQEPAHKATVGVVVEIQTRNIEVYSAVLRVNAYFKGIRYLMFYWPVLSAVIGVGTVFSFLLVLVLLSWYRFFWAPEEEFVVTVNMEQTPISMEERRRNARKALNRERLALGHHVTVQASIQGMSTTTQTTPTLARIDPLPFEDEEDAEMKDILGDTEDEDEADEKAPHVDDIDPGDVQDQDMEVRHRAAHKETT
ncbi:seipin-like isoform X2 [Branchiostoma floridae]|uniref:Seipin n=1 Tax=Branchiostoma floridae TaxID=7739 RepID=A0A9J7KP07_BRAFL|nr:seipin-like isoform X2 [Branchiostoma floridae]